MQCTLFSFNLLKDKVICLSIEVSETGSGPLLILLGIILLQAIHVLSQLLQHFGFEVARLARDQFTLWSILRAPDLGYWRRCGFGVKLPLLPRGRRRGDISTSTGSFAEDPLLWQYYGFHDDF